MHKLLAVIINDAKNIQEAEDRANKTMEEFLCGEVFGRFDWFVPTSDSHARYGHKSDKVRYAMSTLHELYQYQVDDIKNYISKIDKAMREKSIDELAIDSNFKYLCESVGIASHHYLFDEDGEIIEKLIEINPESYAVFFDGHW